MITLPTLALSLLLSDLGTRPEVGLICPAPVIRLPGNEVPRNVRPWTPKPPAAPAVIQERSRSK
jgi:hypothetical protein